MPTVPIYSSPTIAPTALPGVRQQTPYRMMQAAEIGPGQAMAAGKAMLTSGAEAMHEITLDQIQQNEAEAKDIDARHMAAIQGVLAGDGQDPTSGYLNKKGQDAVSTYQTTAEKLQQLPTQLAEGASNPRVAEMIKNLAQTRTTAALGQVKLHQTEQLGVYEKAASETRVRTAVDGAATAYNPITDTPGVSFNHDEPATNSPYQQYLQTIVSEVNDRLDRNGVRDEKVRGELVKEALSGAYVRTLGHMIDKKGGRPADMKLAQAYFDKVKDDIPTEQQDKIRAVLEAGTQKNQALEIALSLKGAGGIDAQEKSLDQMFKDGKITADVHGIALQHLRADNAQRRSEQGEADKSLLGTVWDLARKGGKLTDLNPSQMSYIKTRGLGTNVDAIFKQAEPGGAAGPDDSRLYVDLMNMSRDDAANFLRTDLALVSGQLSQGHFNQLVALQNSINKQDARAMEVNKIQGQAISDAKAGLLAAGFDLSPKEGTDKAKDLAAFQANLHDQLEAAQQGWAEKKLTAPQMREESRKLVLGALKEQALSGTGVGGWFKTKLPIWKMTSEQRAADWDVPEVDRTRIKSQLKAGGLPDTEHNVQRYFKIEQGVKQ